MRKTLVIIVLVLVAVAGCKQPQQPRAPMGYNGAMIKSDDEIRQLQQIVNQMPKNTEALIALGNALMDSNRFSEAVEAYGKALVLDPKNVDVRVDRGTCLKNSGSPDKAVEEFRKAIAINPKHLFAHRNMGVVLAFDLKDKKGAIKEFEKYLELSPNAPDAADIRTIVQNLKTGV